MGRVIPFPGVSKPPGQPSPPKVVDLGGYPRVTLDDIMNFDYRGVYKAISADPLLKQEYKKLSSDVTNLALGAIIAQRIAHDQRSASDLAGIFNMLVSEGASQCRLIHIPTYALGYVWSYNNWLLVNARTAIFTIK